MRIQKFILFFLFFHLGVLSAYAQEKKANDDITIAIDWLANPNHSGIYVAMANGYYKDAGIHLTITPYGEIAPEQLVALKKADIAFMGAEGLMIANENNIDVTAIATALSQNIQYIASAKQQEISRPKDFGAKTYASWSNGWDTALVNQMIKADGGTKKVKPINIGVDGPTALFADKVDLAWFFDNVETAIADKQQIKINKFYFKDYGLANYGTPLLVARSKDIEKNKILYQRFITATELGYLWAAKHPEKTVDILIEYNPPGSFEDRQLLLEQQKISSQYYLHDDQWGIINPEEMKKLAHFMIKNQFAKNLNSLKYTNIFLKP